MKKKYINIILIISTVTGWWASCGIIHPYHTPQMRTDSLFRDDYTTDTNTIATLHWDQIFTDTALQRLIDRGIRNNLDLKVAYTRIEQAQATLEQSRLALYPTLSASGNAAMSKLSDAQTNGRIGAAQTYQVGLNSNWEILAWGRLRATRRANLAALLETEAEARAVQTELVGNIANNYYSLLALDRQLAITQQTVQIWIAIVQTMRLLKEGDVVTEAAVVQSEASRYAAEVSIPDIRQNIRTTENALSILLGDAPGPVPRDSLKDQQPIAYLQTGVPAQLLANRPDVQAAEYSFRNYFELTNVARTYFYPSVSITASAGLYSLTPGGLFSGNSIVGSIGAGIMQPIFDGGVNRARLKIAKAQQQGAYYTFQQTLLTAGQEVSDALSSYQNAADKMDARTKQLDALAKAVEYTQLLLRYGTANYTEVLTAQQSLLSAQLGQVNDQLQRLQAVVNLYRALGGGWR